MNKIKICEIAEFLCFLLRHNVIKVVTVKDKLLVMTPASRLNR